MKVLFIPAKINDNQVGLEKDPGYPDRLKQSNPATAAALLDGNWAVFQGQAFPQWDQKIHTCQDFTIPIDWPRWRACDYGYSHPFDAQWFTTNPANGRMYVYRELNARKWTTAQQAKMINQATLRDEHIYYNFAGHDYWTQHSVDDIATDHASVYQEHGIILTKADVARVIGKGKIDELLTLREDGKPGIQIFKSCVQLIAIMPLLVLSETNPEDVMKMDGDDPYDCLRYGLTNMKSKHEQQPKKRKPEERGWKNPF